MGLLIIQERWSEIFNLIREQVIMYEVTYYINIRTFSFLLESYFFFDHPSDSIWSHHLRHWWTLAWISDSDFLSLVPSLPSPQMIHQLTHSLWLMLHNRGCFRFTCTITQPWSLIPFFLVLCRLYCLSARMGNSLGLGEQRAQWTHLSTLWGFRNFSDWWYHIREHSNRHLCRKHTLETRTFPDRQYPIFAKLLLRCQSWLLF